jgi:hypothetical protein
MKQEQFSSQSSLLGMFDNDFEKVFHWFWFEKVF